MLWATSQVSVQRRLSAKEKSKTVGLIIPGNLAKCV